MLDIDMLTDIVSEYDCFISSFLDDFCLISSSEQELLTCIYHIGCYFDVTYILDDLVFIDNEYRVYFNIWGEI